MKQKLWAIEIDETSITGEHKKYIEVRLQKNPPLNIPYQSAMFLSFDEANEWAKTKNVDLKFGRQKNKWNNDVKIFEYGNVNLI